MLTAQRIDQGAQKDKRKGAQRCAHESVQESADRSVTREDGAVRRASWQQSSLFPGLVPDLVPSRPQRPAEPQCEPQSEPNKELIAEVRPNVRGRRHLQGTGRRANRGSVGPAERHLRAARRLSREIRGLRADRAARTAAGLAICGHLLASLEASQSQRCNVASAPLQGSQPI